MRTFNLKKCLKEIEIKIGENTWSIEYDLGTMNGLNIAKRIIKSNIQEKSIPKNPFWKNFKNTGV
jgi:hypothetical protein